MVGLSIEKGGGTEPRMTCLRELPGIAGMALPDRSLEKRKAKSTCEACA